jgi:hypothetical protein
MSATTKQRACCRMIGVDGNIFALMGAATRCLRNVGRGDDAGEMGKRVTACTSYEDALGVLFEYVTEDSDDDDCEAQRTEEGWWDR